MAHIRNTAIQYNLPEIEMTLSCAGNRKEIDLHFPDPQVRKSVQVDIAMIEAHDDVLNILEVDIEKTARSHDGHALMLLRSVRGIGDILGLVLLYEIHDIKRFGTVQDFASYCRLVKCSHESAGKKKGTGGAKMGNVHLKWAFCEAAVSFVRLNSSVKRLFDNLVKLHGKGKAYAIIAHRLARAVYYMLKNKVPFDLKRFLAAA
jgi:transposase